MSQIRSMRRDKECITIWKRYLYHWFGSEEDQSDLWTLDPILKVDHDRATYVLERKRIINMNQKYIGRIIRISYSLNLVERNIQPKMCMQ